MILFHCFQYRLEKLGVFFGKFGENLAVNGDVIFFKRVDEAAVIGAVLAADRVDMDVPHGAIFAFFHFAVAIIVGKRFHHRLFRRGKL